VDLCVTHSTDGLQVDRIVAAAVGLAHDVVRNLRGGTLTAFTNGMIRQVLIADLAPSRIIAALRSGAALRILPAISLGSMGVAVTPGPPH
jgi:hypothetical protein